MVAAHGADFFSPAHLPEVKPAIPILRRQVTFKIGAGHCKFTLAVTGEIEAIWQRSGMRRIGRESPKWGGRLKLFSIWGNFPG